MDLTGRLRAERRPVAREVPPRVSQSEEPDAEAVVDVEQGRVAPERFGALQAEDERGRSGGGVRPDRRGRPYHADAVGARDVVVQRLDGPQPPAGRHRRHEVVVDVHRRDPSENSVRPHRGQELRPDNAPFAVGVALADHPKREVRVAVEHRHVAHTALHGPEEEAVTEVQGESPALQGGDESDNRLHKPPTIARPDIPTDD